jgi:hypothetical protein
MVVGITMIKVLRGSEDEVHIILQKSKSVKELYQILGEYTFFVIFQAENNLLLHRFIDEIKCVSAVIAVWHLLISYEDLSINRETHFEANRLGVSGYSQCNILMPGSEHS